MVIDMTRFIIPMYVHVDIDDAKISDIPLDIVRDNVAFDKTITSFIREELLSYCKTTENMVELSVFIDDIPYQDAFYEG
jgi:hypothetical protein